MHIISTSLLVAVPFASAHRTLSVVQLLVGGFLGALASVFVFFPAHLKKRGKVIGDVYSKLLRTPLVYNSHL